MLKILFEIIAAIIVIVCCFLLALIGSLLLYVMQGSGAPALFMITAVALAGVYGTWRIGR